MAQAIQPVRTIRYRARSSTGWKAGATEMKTDEALMRELKAGAQNAFDTLFARYRDRVYGFFRRRLAHAARAEELAQETFLAVLRGAAQWEPRALFRTWLFGIAMNQLFAERRKTASRPEDALTGREAAPNESRPEQGLWVRQALGRLEEGDREILMLREYEQLSYDEIAELLKIPVNTVRSRLFRARMALRDALLGTNVAAAFRPAATTVQLNAALKGSAPGS